MKPIQSICQSLAHQSFFHALFIKDFSYQTLNLHHMIIPTAVIHWVNMQAHSQGDSLGAEEPPSRSFWLRA